MASTPDRGQEREAACSSGLGGTQSTESTGTHGERDSEDSLIGMSWAETEGPPSRGAGVMS